MKKKVLTLALACSMLLTLMGCSKDFTKEIDKYVYLGQYKGLEYTEADLTVTDEELDKAITAYMSAVPVKDRAVANGDVANIDFVGYVDGVAFDGGTAYGYDLAIGSGSMIPGFEEGIVGMMPGETKSIHVTFPEQYRPEGTSGSELNGQPAVFDITVHHILASVDGEYNEAFVTEYTEYATMEEFEQSLIDKMVAEKEATAASEKLDALFNQVMKNAVIHQLPESELNRYHDSLIDSYQTMADSFELSLEEFLATYYYTTVDYLNQYADQYAQSMATQTVIFHAIAKAEGLTVSDEEYQKGLEEYYENMGNAYEDRKNFEKEVGDLVKEALLFEKVEQVVIDSAVAVPAED